MILASAGRSSTSAQSGYEVKTFAPEPNDVRCVGRVQATCETHCVRWSPTNGALATAGDPIAIHPSIANDYSETRTRASHRARYTKRTTKAPRGAATHAGLVEPCFTLAPRRDNERDAVSGAVTDAMADIVR